MRGWTSMNEGGILSACDCPCGCKEDSYFRYCGNCNTLHIKYIREQIREEKEYE